MKTKYFSILAIVMLLTMFSNVKAQTSTEKENARVFVQKFYDEYIHHYNSLKRKDMRNNAMPYMISHNSQYFSDTLLATFKQNEVEDYLFEPFLSRRERDKLNYQTGNVKQSDNSFFVDVHTGLINESRKIILSTPAVMMVRVDNVNNHWKLVNFYYLTIYDNGDYLETIRARKLSQEEMEKHPLSYSTGKYIK